MSWNVLIRLSQSRITFYNLHPVQSTSTLFVFCSCRTQQKLETAYSDEPFLLVPEIKALSEHPLRILNTSVEVRLPMRLLNDSVSQLTGCTLYKESVANECYAIQIKRQDLASSSLDVQGNYWLYDKICHPHTVVLNL